MEQDWKSSPNVTRTDKTLVVKDLFIVNDTEAQLLRGQRIRRTVVSSSLYTSSASDFIIGVTNLGVAPTIGLPLPSLAGNGKSYIIKDEAGGAATTTITIRSDGEKTIDGATSTTLTTNYQSKRFYSDGSQWFTM
jgi:hypothetical protein